MIDAGILRRLNNLEDLDLSNNSITDISCLEQISSLKFLLLSNNHIKDIGVLLKLPNLTIVELSNNPLQIVSDPVTSQIVRKLISGGCLVKP